MKNKFLQRKQLALNASDVEKNSELGSAPWDLYGVNIIATTRAAFQSDITPLSDTVTLLKKTSNVDLKYRR